MSRPVKWTEAEKRSFRLVPETCDKVHEAIAKVRSCGTDELFAEVLAKYRIEPNQNLRHAFAELHSRSVNMALFALSDVVMYECTFPLRLALVESIERDMRASGEVVEVGHYAHWIGERIGKPEARTLAELKS